MQATCIDWDSHPTGTGNHVKEGSLEWAVGCRQLKVSTRILLPLLLLGASPVGIAEGDPVSLTGQSIFISEERLALHSMDWGSSTRRSPGSERIVVQNNGPLELHFSLIDGSSDVRLAPEAALAFPCEPDGHPALASIGDAAGMTYLVSLSCGDALQFSVDDNL
jgi:hypothetical protein